MKVLVGCECSGRVRDAFRAEGHEAWSCDIKPCETREHAYHYQMDIMKALFLQDWDIIILHPDCTCLAVSGNAWYGKGTGGEKKREYAIRWTQRLWGAAKAVAKVGVALENPVSVLADKLGVKPQYIQPWQFGHGETKRTGLWLHNLPPLKPTRMVKGRKPRVQMMAPSPTRKADRSRTYKGIARAMAKQWGSL